MKVAIRETEWWPVVILEDDFEFEWGDEIEVSEEFFKKYTELMDRFDDLQVELRKLYRGD